MNDDATVINNSGKLRAISYHMSQISNRLNSYETNIDTKALIDTLRLRMSEYESILWMLTEKQHHGIIKHEPTIRKLEQIQIEWDEIFKPAYQNILLNDRADQSTIHINKMIDKYISNINEMVTTYTEHVKEKLVKALVMNGVFIFLIIVVAIYSFTLTNTRIRRPMNTLIKDLKELSIIEDDIPLQFEKINTNEISEMNQYFNFMIYDQLTNAFNRRSGLAKLNRLFQEYNRKHLTFSLCFIDINGLKAVNDQLGHKFGDELIVSVIECIKQEIRQEDFIIRMGGDEFLLVIHGIGVQLSEKVWERINHRYKKINEQEGRPYIISVSHGIVECNNLMEIDIEALIKIADHKMYAEKKYLKEELKIKIIRS